MIVWNLDIYTTVIIRTGNEPVSWDSTFGKSSVDTSSHHRYQYIITNQSNQIHLLYRVCTSTSIQTSRIKQNIPGSSHSTSRMGLMESFLGINHATSEDLKFIWHGIFRKTNISGIFLRFFKFRFLNLNEVGIDAHLLKFFFKNPINLSNNDLDGAETKFI